MAVHQFGFVERVDTLEMAEEGATFLLNSPYGPEEVWDKIPRSLQQQIIDKKIKFFVIDAYKVAKEVQLGARINTIMQTGFFALSGVLPEDEAIAKIKEYIRKTYGKRGEAIVRMNFAAVDAALSHMFEVEVPAEATSTIEQPPVVPAEAPDFVQNVTAEIMAGRGDLLPVSALPDDGTYPTGTTQWEKRNIALDIPVWETDLCIQCGKCVNVCPHSVIRAKVVPEDALAGAPETFKYADARWREFPDQQYVLQVAPEDCTACKLCVEVCPAKDKSNVSRKALNMASQIPIREQECENWDFFLNLPEVPRYGTGDGGAALKFNKVKNVQLLQPLFEFSGACAGCGETPYIRTMTQLFGDRALIANATGCSSIYGGNLPTTPYTVDANGRGPTWSNSLFEDNAEFGLGMRLAIDKQMEYAQELVGRLRDRLGHAFAGEILMADQSDEAGIAAQRERVAKLKEMLKDDTDLEARDLVALADVLVHKSVWIVGGDGWAYDIGYGGLDHVLASGRNVNVLVLDTEVYSNTGGQASKATGLGAVAKFAAGGKPTPKKDLGLLAMGYGYVYVAQIAMGSNDNQTIKAILEAESYDGPSLIIAYSHCIAHGIDIAKGLDQQDRAVKSGHWPLYRYDPRRKKEGKNPFQIDSKAPSLPLKEYIYNENRYRILQRMKPEAAAEFLKEAERLIAAKWKLYTQMAQDDSDAAAKSNGKPGPKKKPALPGAKGDGAAATPVGATPAAPPPASKPIAKGKGKLPPGFG